MRALRLLFRPLSRMQLRAIFAKKARKESLINRPWFRAAKAWTSKKTGKVVPAADIERRIVRIGMIRAKKVLKQDTSALANALKRGALAIGRGSKRVLTSPVPYTIVAGGILTKHAMQDPEKNKWSLPARYGLGLLGTGVISRFFLNATNPVLFTVGTKGTKPPGFLTRLGIQHYVQKQQLARALDKLKTAAARKERIRHKANRLLSLADASNIRAVAVNKNMHTLLRRAARREARSKKVLMWLEKHKLPEASRIRIQENVLRRASLKFDAIAGLHTGAVRTGVIGQHIMLPAIGTVGAAHVGYRAYKRRRG